MLITFERVWAVGRFDVGRSLFVVPQQPRAGTVATGGVFETFRGTPHRNAPKGVKQCQKGDFPA